ncbi:MAG: TauD/TfdA family dioxygenase [Alphaproteobacteria bacterium]|nr:TauD/TfdA family dioxygenase [Alphaproteobacteria bacterium]
MSYDTFEVRPLAGALGAEITGIDVRRLDNRMWSELHQAFLDFQVIAIRNQDLAADDIMAFARRFGEPNHYPFVKGMDGYPFLFEIVKEPNETRNFGGGWHSDTTYLAQPPLATLLYAVQTPAKGGDTLYCNTAAAYDALSDTMKDLLGRLKGVNSAGLKHTGGRAAHHARIGGMKIQGTETADSYEAVHPVVRTCPDTGRKALYVSRAHTVRFEGMTEDESRPLIEWLQSHQTRPEFTCRVHWQPGTMTVWDNRCTQHSAINDYNGQRRVMRRVTVGPQTPM